MARYQVGNEIFEIDDAVPEAEAVEAINKLLAQPRDSALDFSYDSARQMTGAGLETIGDLSEKYFGGDLGISEYGQDLRQRAADDIAKGRYQRASTKVHLVIRKALAMQPAGYYKAFKRTLCPVVLL